MKAPECLLTDGFYSFPMDVWSAGCVMFEMITYEIVIQIKKINHLHDAVILALFTVNTYLEG